MTIINVQANDYGIYYCEGSNKLGKNNATVLVYGKYGRLTKIYQKFLIFLKFVTVVVLGHSGSI